MIDHFFVRHTTITFENIRFACTFLDFLHSHIKTLKFFWIYVMINEVFLLWSEKTVQISLKIKVLSGA